MVILFIAVSNPTQLKSCYMLKLSTAVMCIGPSFPRIRDDDLPTSRNRYQRLVICADFESILKPVDGDVDTIQGVAVGGESSSRVYKSTSHAVLSIR